MKRSIEVRTGALRITATIDSGKIRNGALTRDEVERMRDELADRLQDAASGLIYDQVPRNRVLVR